MSGAQPPRRSTHVEHEVVYAAVGASAAADLMRFPPEGSTPFEAEQRLGSGADRFLTASTLLMTWGAQRGAGIRVADVVDGDGGGYPGVSFDEHGTPQPAGEVDVEYGPDGEPFLAAGATATLHWVDGRAPRRIRVVYTLSESRRAAFAVGSADEGELVGEEVFAVEHREDDTVWATVRGFLWVSAAGVLGLKGKAAVKQAIKEAREQIAALAPGAQADADSVADPEPPVEDPERAGPEAVAVADPEPIAVESAEPAAEEGSEPVAVADPDSAADAED